MSSLTLKTTFAQYTTGQLIGEGGAGHVYKATDESGSIHAIKILDARRVTADKVKRFRNEIQFGLQNNHPNVITVMDHGVHIDGKASKPFYVMSFYPQTLRHLLKTGIPLDKVLPYFGHILDGVEAAHLQKIIHRDLKPENILYDSKTDQLVVEDFGIAHFEEEELYTAVETSDRDRLANFQYAAPEQRRRGQTVDLPADIYAAGLILNEMYTQEVPQGTGYLKISTVAAEFSYLDEIVALMIRQNPTDRPESIARVKEQLVAHKNDFITQQRISQLRKTVIPETEVDDPLIADPIRLVEVDYVSGGLIFKLSHPVNDLWRHAFRNFGTHSAVYRKGPEVFVLKDDEARISASERDAQSILDNFKDWLPRVNQKYDDLVREKNDQEIEKRRRDLRLKIEMEEERKRILDNLKL